MHESYKHGSILKLTLKNFQTYKSIEFTFHPQLNFIAGPNGSGKSSIANALAFVFYGTPSTIGKTKDLSEYVNFNAHDASVEAQIKFENKIVFLKRSFNKTSKKSIWYINNVEKKGKDYKDFVDSLNVNVNNLCQFLPQEKVAEFSGLGAEELLNCALESQNNKSIVDMKNDLGELEKKFAELQCEIDKNRKKKDGIGQIVKNMSKNVEKLREKARKEEKIRNMELKRKYLFVDLFQSEYKTIRKNMNILKKEVEAKKEEIEECLRTIKDLREGKEMKELEAMKKNVELFNLNARNKIKEVKQVNNQIKNMEIDLESIERRKEARINEIENIERALQNNIAKIEQIKVPVVPKWISEIDDIKELEYRKVDLRIKSGKIQESSRKLQLALDEWNEKQREINNEDIRRLEYLKKFHYPTYNAVIWLRDNKHKFKEEIIEPTILSIKIKDTTYVNEIETFLGHQILTTFICKNQSDFENFVRILKDEKKLGINACQMGNEVYKNIIGNEELRMLGFDCILIDLIECRSEIRNFLCNFGAFNNIPVTKKNVDESIISNKYDVKRMAARSKYIEIKKSQYTSEKLIMESYLKPLKLFSGVSITETNEIVTKIKEINYQKKENEKLNNVILTEMTDIDQEIGKLRKKKNDYMELVSESLKIKTQKEQLAITIEHSKQQLEILRDFTTIEEDKKHIENRLEEEVKCFGIKSSEFDLYLKNEEFFISMRKLILLEREVSYNESVIQQQKAKIITIEDENRLHERMIAKYEEQLKDKKEELQKYKEKIKNFGLKAEEKAILETLPGSIEELEIQIAAESAKLPFYDCDASVEQNYAEKEEQMNKVHLKLSNLETKQEIMNERMKNLRNDTVKKINKIVDPLSTRFSDFFKKFNCEGKIEFFQENLVSNKWRLNILVKFRESSKLELLTSTRQSGGEKSVSTILFLLALQSISSAPFRLVDEINQGMDKYNEKLVHDTLVSLSTPDSPQFFIITPKLVPGLTFGENMKIHIIFAGFFTFKNEVIENSKCKTLKRFVAQ